MKTWTWTVEWLDGLDNEIIQSASGELVLEAGAYKIVDLDQRTWSLPLNAVRCVTVLGNDDPE